MDEGGQLIILTFSGSQDFIGQVFIGETKRATEAILDQRFSEAAGEFIRLPLGDQIP